MMESFKALGGENHQLCCHLPLKEHYKAKASLWTLSIINSISTQMLAASLQISNYDNLPVESGQ